MSARPTPAEVVDEIAARMTIPAPTGDPTPFVLSRPGQRGPEDAQEGAQEAAGGQTKPAHVQDGNGAQTGAEGFEGDA